MTVRWRRHDQRGVVLSCPEVVELITDYLDGTLPPDQAADVAAHLEACPDCPTYVEQIRTSVLALGALPAPQLSQQACDVLVAAFRSRPPA